jgi:ABC-2 type transport system permease protein
MPRETAIVARHTMVLLARDPGTFIAYAVMSSVLMAVLRPVFDRLAPPGVPGILDAAAGTAVMFTLLAIDVAGEQLLAERDWRTWSRLRATPAHPAALLVGKAIPLIGVFVVLQGLLFAEAWLFFGLDLASGTWRLPLLWLTWSCCVTAIGLALGAWLRTRGQLGAVADIGAMVMTGLSGALVPISALPCWFRRVAPATPAYWAVHGFHAALDSQGGASYQAALTILSAAALAAGAVAVLRTLPPGRW